MKTFSNSIRILFVFGVLVLTNSCSAKEQVPPDDDSIDQEEVLVQETANSEETEEINAELPEIIGTSWSLMSIYEKGTEPVFLRIYPEFLFCKNGRWELLSLTNSQGQMGTYTIDGDRLTTVNDGADNLTANYKITWNEADQYMELDNGELIFRMRFRAIAKC
ncbi:MAG: hypothetical protein PSV36_18745 [Algoriphagus sp.]|nr:hypothetical protein [Algoriphagus sp.]